MKLLKDFFASRKLSKLRKDRRIKVKTLTLQHFVMLSDLIEKYASELNIESVTNLISSAQSAGTSETDKETVGKQVHSLGVEILKKITTIAKTDVFAFLAELIDVTPEAFLEMPIDTPLIIIDQIRSAPEAESFFIIQSLGHKLIETFGDPMTMLKEWYASTSEETNSDS